MNVWLKNVWLKVSKNLASVEKEIPKCRKYHWDGKCESILYDYK